MQIIAEQLVERIQAGEQDAFQEFVALCRDRAYRLCYSMVGNAEDAKDILQEAMIKTYRNAGRFRKKASFSTWFYSILVNTARDFLRRRAHQELPLLKEVVDFRAGAGNVVLTRELGQLLERVISQLPQKQRLCFIMKHHNDMKLEEIAQVLNCTPSTVKVHLFRAVRSLQKKLSVYLNP